MKIRYINILRHGDKYKHTRLLENIKITCPECNNEDHDLLENLNVSGPYIEMLCHICKCIFVMQMIEG